MREKNKILNFLLLKNVTLVKEMDLSQDHSPDRCTTCGGNGKVRSNQGFFTVQQTCPQCAGSGEEITNPCAKIAVVKVIRKLQKNICNNTKGC